MKIMILLLSILALSCVAEEDNVAEQIDAIEGCYPVDYSCVDCSGSNVDIEACFSDRVEAVLGCGQCAEFCCGWVGTPGCLTFCSDPCPICKICTDAI